MCKDSLPCQGVGAVNCPPRTLAKRCEDFPRLIAKAPEGLQAKTDRPSQFNPVNNRALPSCTLPPPPPLPPRLRSLPLLFTLPFILGAFSRFGFIRLGWRKQTKYVLFSRFRDYPLAIKSLISKHWLNVTVFRPISYFSYFVKFILIGG